MCIIIDTNTLAGVFLESSENHLEFKPIRDWIVEGKGKIVFGGTRYTREIPSKYLNIILQFKKAGQAIFVKNDLVDKEEALVNGMIKNNDFDDQHLVGLLRVSKCKLICSIDERAYPFFRHSIFFKSAKNKPKIYSSSSNKNLLCVNNIAEICKPCSVTTKHEKALLNY